MKREAPPTKVILIHAGPTPWEVADRVVGNQSLPLTADARVAIEQLVSQLPEGVASVYGCRANEACTEVAKLVAARFKLRVRDRSDLCGFNLGLWQGLTYEAIRARYPTIYAQWYKNPLLVEPPDGETLEGAIDRVGGAMREIVRRNRNKTSVVVLRPLDLLIAIGLLRHETAEQIAAHLQDTPSIMTIEMSDEA